MNFIKAEDMMIGHYYVTKKGTKFKVISHQEDGFIVLIASDKSYRKVPFDYDVVSVQALKERISQEEVNQFVDFVKKNCIGVQEKKTYLNFVKDNIKYKLLYGAQKVLCLKYMGEYRPVKWKNNYWAYKLSVIKDFLMRENKSVY